MTLAHELGHGIHQYLANKNGVLLADTPLTLAETASVFGEMLTFKSLLKKSKNNDEKISLLRSKIEDMLNTVFRQVAFFKFEREIHLQRSKGELTEEEICTIWMNTQKESLDRYKFSDNYRYFGLIYPILFIHLFMFMHMHLEIVVNSLYKKYEDGYDDFEENIINFEAGGSVHYQNHLSNFNLTQKNKIFGN